MKRLILILNGKGGVGKSFFAVNFVQFLKDKGIAHVAIDSDNENSTLKRFHPDTRFLDLSKRRDLDAIFAALAKTNLVVVDFRLRLNQQSRALLASQLRDWQPTDRSLTEFRRWLLGSEPHLLVTFSQQVALERRELPFITPVHPLARLATDHLKQGTKPLAAHLVVQATEIPAGHYLFVCELWENIAIRPEIRLVSFVWNVTEERLAPDVSEKLFNLLKRTQSSDGVFNLPHDAAVTAIAGLDEKVHQTRDEALAQLLARSEQLVTRKIASLDAYHQNRLARIEKELSTARDERIIRMKTSEKSSVARDHLARRSEIEQRQNADIVRDRIALGILEVRHGE